MSLKPIRQDYFLDWYDVAFTLTLTLTDVSNILIAAKHYSTHCPFMIQSNIVKKNVNTCITFKGLLGAG